MPPHYFLGPKPQAFSQALTQHTGRPASTSECFLGADALGDVAQREQERTGASVMEKLLHNPRTGHGSVFRRPATHGRREDREGRRPLSRAPALLCSRAPSPPFSQKSSQVSEERQGKQTYRNEPTSDPQLLEGAPFHALRRGHRKGRGGTPGLNVQARAETLHRPSSSPKGKLAER